MHRKTTSQLIALITLVLFLNLAYFFDLWIDFLKLGNSENFQPIAILWGYPLTRLLITTAFLWLFWYSLTKTPKGWLIPAVLIFLGLYIVFSPLLYYTPLGTSFLVSPSSLFFTAGALSAASGVLILILKRS